MKQAKLKLTIDLVPETSWFKSLRTQMPRSQWDKLRKQVYVKAGNLCHICGADGRLSCHEIWAYDERRHVQTLKGFRALCSMCHHVTHFGLARVLAEQGYLDLEAVIRHFTKVNKVTRKVFEEHETEAFATWRQRSRRKWRTDLGKWSSLVPSKAKV